MKKTCAIKENREFKWLYYRGKSCVTPLLVLYAKKTKRSGCRLGITVSTKIGKAVVRNRARRRLKECYRLLEGRVVDGCEIVFVARRAIVDASFQNLQKAMEYALKQCQLLQS